MIDLRVSLNSCLAEVFLQRAVSCVNAAKKAIMPVSCLDKVIAFHTRSKTMGILMRMVMALEAAGTTCKREILTDCHGGVAIHDRNQFILVEDLGIKGCITSEIGILNQIVVLKML